MHPNAPVPTPVGVSLPTTSGPTEDLYRSKTCLVLENRYAINDLSGELLSLDGAHRNLR